MYLPNLYVEGKDDISVVSNLLNRHGVDTRRGTQHLVIKDRGNVASVLEFVTEAILASTDRPVGFVVDIDVPVADRWKVIQDKVVAAGGTRPGVCPPEGFLARLDGYPHQFGVWLMPDCSSDAGKLEHLIETLIPDGDPLWSHARQSAARAKELIAEANASGKGTWECFRDIDQIKAEIRTWLAWQSEPGAGLGAAINDRILGCDSEIALRFLRWLRELYGFVALNNL